MPLRSPGQTWDSPLSPAIMAAGAVRLSFPAIEPDGAITWCERCPSEAGRTALVRRGPDGETADLLGPPWDVGSRVHEYGGRAHVIDGGRVWFVHRPTSGCTSARRTAW